MTPVTLPLPCAISEPDIVIPDGADIIWHGSVNLRSNILVESGGKLTITCDIGMPANARITVETGGRLIVDGARIYNTCDGDFWDGIVVVGDSNVDQTNIGGLKQGYVNLRPGSVIEGAYIGVRLFDPSQPQNTSGGIISANGATFYNNTGGVAIARYQGTNPITGGALGYNATFSGCRFLVDGNIGGGLGSFAYMANLHGVDGVRFLGCDFTNDFPSDQASFADNMGYGIQAWDAGFSVEGKCLGSVSPCQSYQRSKFKGFQTGIYAQGKGWTTNTFRVSRADFEHNARGVVSSSVHNIFVAQNTFEVGMGIPYQYVNNPFVGIQVLRGTGFTIEENELKPTPLGLPTSAKAVGIVIVSSGQEMNEVYKNSLDALFTGNLANGKNRNDQLPDKGLQYLCNLNSTNVFDIAVSSEYGVPATIAAKQGSLNQSAGNTFTALPVEQEGHIQNDLEPIEYFYSFGMNPINFTISNVTLTQAAQANACLSNLFLNGDGTITEGEKQQVESDFNNTNSSTERTRLANILIRQALVDTNGMDIPEVRTWLTNKGGIEARFMTVDTWLHEGNTAAAQQSLNNIPNEFTLIEDDLTEYQYFSQYKNLQISAMDNGQSDSQMLAANQATIQQIANAGSYYASTQAQGLINFVQGIIYDPILVLPDPTPPQLLFDSNINSGTASPFESYLGAAPNPANGQTVFSYRLPEGIPNGKLTINSMEGRIIKVFELSGAKGKLVWDTGNVPEGIYLISLVVDGKASYPQKLSIIK